MGCSRGGEHSEALELGHLHRHDRGYLNILLYWQGHGCNYSHVRRRFGADRFSDVVFRLSDPAWSGRHFDS